jgi:hypothetical protein
MAAMSIIAGLTATKAALDIAKLTLDKLNSAGVDVHEVRAGIQEMLIHVVNAQVALGEANVEISELRQQLNDREALKVIEADLEYQIDGGHYLRKSDGAWCCPVCWGDQKRVVPMAPMASGFYRCPLHNQAYHTKAAEEAQARALEEANRGLRRRAGGSNDWMR